MKPHKYKFFLTSANQPAAPIFKEGASIDPDTGFIYSGANYAYTAKTSINGIKYFYFNVKALYKGAATIKPFIQFYDSANRVIATEYIGFSVIPAPEGATTYAINMRTSDYPSYQFRDNSFFLLALEEALPHYKKLTKKISKESNEMFYRDSLTGDITFHNKDFATVSEMDLTTKGLFLITKDDNSLMYKQEFSKVDFEIDYFRKSAKLKLKTVDAYTDILAKQDKKFNITKLGAAMANIAVSMRPVIQLYAMGSDVVSSYYQGSYSEGPTSEAQDDFKTLVEQYHFAYCASAQEFEIYDASDSRINGVYSGQGGNYSNPNGCTAKLSSYSSGNNNIGYLYLYLPDGSEYGYSSMTATYQENDFSGIERSEMIEHYPNCIYFTALVGDDNNNIFYGTVGDTVFGKAVPGKIKNIIVHHIMGRILTARPGGTSIVLPSGTAVTNQDLREDDFAYEGRNYKSAIPFEVKIYTTANASSEPTEYGFNDYGAYFTDDFPSSPGKVWPLGRNLWGNASMWYATPSGFSTLISSASYGNIIKDTYTLQSVISMLLKKNELPLRHRAADSKFLYDATDPILQTSRWKNILLSPITNVLKSDYTQAAQRGDISLEMVFDMLRKVFNCYWYIEDGYLKIEHLSFFLNNKSYSALTPNAIIDITALQDQFNKMPYSYDQHKISYDTKDLASQYTFSYPEETTEIFTKVKLSMQKVPYIDPSVDQEVKVDMFSADVDSMLLKPDDFNNDSLALLLPDNTPSWGYTFLNKEFTVWDEKKRSYKVYPQNWYASWLHLLNYHLADIPTSSASNSLGITLNAIPSQKKFVKQAIKLPDGLSIEPYQGIKTDVGIGLLESINVELDTGIAEIELRHKP